MFKKRGKLFFQEKNRDNCRGRNQSSNISYKKFTNLFSYLYIYMNNLKINSIIVYPLNMWKEREALYINKGGVGGEGRINCF